MDHETVEEIKRHFGVVAGELREELKAHTATVADGLREDLKRHMGIVAEDMRSNVQLVAEGVQALDERLTRFEAKVDTEFEKVQGQLERVDTEFEEVKAMIRFSYADLD